jgi:hypothetical protein
MMQNEQVAAVALMLKAVHGSEVWLRDGRNHTRGPALRTTYVKKIGG